MLDTKVGYGQYTECTGLCQLFIYIPPSEVCSVPPLFLCVVEKAFAFVRPMRADRPRGTGRVGSYWVHKQQVVTFVKSVLCLFLCLVSPYRALTTDFIFLLLSESGDRTQETFTVVKDKSFSHRGADTITENGTEMRLQNRLIA
jgi:hypothetical protein